MVSNGINSTLCANAVPNPLRAGPADTDLRGRLRMMRLDALAELPCQDAAAGDRQAPLCRWLRHGEG
jgi:hypothetical protein